MAPKFRGGSDDWLDDEDSSPTGRARPKKAAPAAEFLPPEAANAVVAEVFPKQCRVVLMQAGPGEAAPVSLLCSYKRARVLKSTAGEGARERSPVAVGDRVLVERINPVNGVVEGVCARRNRLLRPAPGDDQGRKQHVVASNLDRLVIVASVARPEFSSGLVDRYLVAAQAAGIPASICITKTDLLPASAEAGPRPAWELYRELGFEVIEVSSKVTGKGIAELRERLTGEAVAFCGHSGVGKTSLLRVLLGSEEIGKVGEISDATGKGRHTTTGAVLVGGPDSSQWIDTPGVREFGLADVTPEALAGYFPELASLDCARDRGCRHEGEEGCQAEGLPRYPSYRRILQSLREGEH